MLSQFDTISKRILIDGNQISKKKENTNSESPYTHRSFPGQSTQVATCTLLESLLRSVDPHSSLSYQLFLPSWHLSFSLLLHLSIDILEGNKSKIRSEQEKHSVVYKISLIQNIMHCRSVIAVGLNLDSERVENL